MHGGDAETCMVTLVFDILDEIVQTGVGKFCGIRFMGRYFQG
jgi:hypothetical protein